MKRAGCLIGPGMLAALIAAGCGGNKNPLLLPNQPPEVELFALRAGPSTYRLQWALRDPDGNVDHFLYVWGSPTDDCRSAAWTSTTARERSLSFPARAPSPARASIVAVEPSVFSVRAVDGLGAMSPLAQVAFFDGALAPRVEIVSPRPSSLVRHYVGPSLCVEWTGAAFDDDTTAERVREYKYILLTDATGVSVATARMDPDSVRRYYAARDWEGWTSVRGSVTSAVLRDLTPEKEYVFAITCFDEDGNYDPVFSRDKNMLLMRAISAVNFLPTITVSNGYTNYTSGPGTSPQVNLEIPSGQPVSFNWFATTRPGRQITGYRWALDLVQPDSSSRDDDGPDRRDRRGHHGDGDRDDENRRGGPVLRAGQWSPWRLATTSATVGPFAGGGVHRFYVEARDGSGCGGDAGGVSLVIITLTVVQAAFARDLLIVDDTRLTLDRVNVGTSCDAPANRPMGRWPTAAELDTFLYARGGTPWRCYPPGTVSTPGIFSGYDFDTLGTNMRIQDLTVRLSRLVQYRHVIWLVDAAGAHNSKPGTDPGDINGPQTSMRYMNDVQRENTLAAYVRQGGQVWLAGGGAATAATVNFNKSNNDNNPPNPRTLTFANANGELVPGRFIYDQAHWRSEFKQYKVNNGRIRRYLGRLETNPGIYQGLPAEIGLKTTASDPVPPNRTGQSIQVFYQSAFDAEFLSAPNEIREDADPGRLENLQSTLDTLYRVTASELQPDIGPGAMQSVVMTYYHGAENAPFVHTGFNLWNFRRPDCVGLVDFVLQQLWGMTRSQTLGAAAVTPSGSLPVGRLARPREETASRATDVAGRE